MTKALQEMAQEISQALMRELEARRAIETPLPSTSLVDLYLQRLADQVVEHISKAGSPAGTSEGALEARLARVEERLARVTGSDPDSDPTPAATGRTSYPNLKYAQPKYKNVESILKHVESPEDRGGVKLVIMNFND